MKYLIWRCVNKDTEVTVKMDDIEQLRIGKLYISWDDNTELYLRYYYWDRFELHKIGNVTVVKVVGE